ncbi:hypothetical protein J6590_038155 [Homalodisca vitripennis]|nr:hypothetical protein J6590_038155 [Homalodisca vitripennis]
MDNRAIFLSSFTASSQDIVGIGGSGVNCSESVRGNSGGGSDGGGGGGGSSSGGTAVRVSGATSASRPQHSRRSTRLVSYCLRIRNAYTYVRLKCY